MPPRAAHVNGLGVNGLFTHQLGDAVTGYLSTLRSGGANDLSTNANNAVAIAKAALTQVATQQGRSNTDLVAEMMTLGLSEYYATDELWQRWEMLSEREQQMVALTCLGYTNGQIAYRMGLSVHTFKFYLHSSLVKFGVRSKADLRQVLGGWDFSAWISHR